MTLLDLRLTDPGSGVVLDAVTRAFDNVNSYGPASRISATKAALKRIADRTVAEPEGVAFVASDTHVGVHNIAAQVIVAWWSAAFGRKHIRVLGRMVDHHQSYLLNETKLNTRPAVWHVYPERVYRRRVAAGNDLIAVCGCGVCGSERTLGWAGPCCGPCFDYTQEHGAPPPTRPALLPTAVPCLAVAVSADSRWVAGATADRVFVWDIDAGTEPRRAFASTGPSGLEPQLALSSDGAILAAIGIVAPGLRVFDLRGERAKGSPVRAVTGAVAFHPSDRDLVVIVDGELIRAELPGCNAPFVAVPRVSDAGPAVFSPDGERVAVRNGENLEIHDLEHGQPPVSFQLPNTVQYGNQVRRPSLQLRAHVAFSADGQLIATGIGEAISVHSAITGDLQFWTGTLPAEVTGVAFDPAGKWLYVGRHDGSLLAYPSDSFKPEKTVTLRWSLGTLRGLAVTGDGETLFSAGDEGVKAWPIRRLLAGV